MRPRSFDRGTAVAMYRDGLSAPQIARLLGATVGSMKMALLRAGVTADERGEDACARWARKLSGAGSANHDRQGSSAQQ